MPTIPDLRTLKKSNVHVDFKGKVAIVTGAARGIGKVIAYFLAQDGCSVAIIDVLEEEAKEAAEEIARLTGAKVLAIKADVTKWSDVKSSVDAVVKQFNRIDILVNNAGIVLVKPITDIEEAEWDKVMAVNLKGSFLMTKAVLPYMIKQNYGRIVNMASVAGVEGNANMTAYSTSKAGLIGFTKALAEETIKYNIRVNAVAPALVEGTALTLSMSEEQRRFLASKIPIGRLIYPEEVADLVKFLASDASEPLTGYVFIIAGGRARA
jgi:3-oxoacyl-[acyl-carrier protein] reductase